MEDQRDARIMAKLKDAVLARVPAEVVNHQLTSYVQRKLPAFFPHFHSPSHPPYASMIQRAIVKLNEEGGSSEGSISEFIRKEFGDLPWQHEAFLTHHLRKLCTTGEILLTKNERYVIAVRHGDFGDEKETGHRMNIRPGRKPCKRQFRGELRRQLKTKVGEQGHLRKQNNEEEQGMEVIGKWTKAKERQTQVLENHCEVRERNEATKQDTEATDHQIEKQSLELNDEERKNLHCQKIEVLEESSYLQELQSEASEEHALACERQNEVVLKQNKLQRLQVEVVYEKQKDDQVIEIFPNVFETSSQCLDRNGFSLHLEEPCMKLVQKKTEFLEELMENSHSLGTMELPKCAIVGPVIGEEKKDCLEVEQQEQLTKSSLTERESSVEVIEAHSKLQHQDNGLLLGEDSQLLENRIEVATEILGFCCFKEDGISENFSVPLGESPFTAERDERTNSLEQKQHKQKRDIVCGERKFTIICGRQAQKLSEPKIYGHQRVCKSVPNFVDKCQSPGQVWRPPFSKTVITTMGASLPLDHGHVHAQDLSKSKIYNQQTAFKSDVENNRQHQSPGQQRSLSSSNPDTSITMTDILPSDQQHNDEQHLPGDRCRAQGRFQKAEGDQDCRNHDVLRVYFRRKRKSLHIHTYVRRKHKA